MADKVDPQKNTASPNVEPTPVGTNGTTDKSVFEELQNGVGILASLSVLFSIIGFIFIFLIVSRQTTLVSFDASPTTYIVYGLVISMLSVIKNAVVIGILLLIFVIGFVAFAVREYRSKHKNQPLSVQFVLRIVWALFEIAVPVLVSIIIMFGMWAALYPESLSDLLNTTSTKKTVISLIFKEDIDSHVWHVLVDDKNPRRTKPLTLIFEYADSLLVKDTTTGSVVKISKDVLAGIVDDTALDPSKLPTLPPKP